MPQHASATFTAARGPEAFRERYCEAKSLLLRAFKTDESRWLERFTREEQ